MKDRYGIELLPNIFRGTGKYKDCIYKLREAKGNIGFFEVCDAWEYRYEVAEIKVVITPILKTGLERYPSDNQLGESLWRFYDGYEALEFFKSKVSCEIA